MYVPWTSRSAAVVRRAVSGISNLLNPMLAAATCQLECRRAHRAWDLRRGGVVRKAPAAIAGAFSSWGMRSGGDHPQLRDGRWAGCHQQLEDQREEHRDRSDRQAHCHVEGVQADL